MRACGIFAIRAQSKSKNMALKFFRPFWQIPKRGSVLSSQFVLLCQSRLKARADQLLQWKTCTSWKSSLIFELQFQIPFDYHDIIPRKRGSNWLFLYKNPTGHRTSYALPILRINDACIEGLEWTARFSKANPGLGGFVPPELIRAASETYICRIVPKPGSIMRKIFSEQVSPAIFEFSQTCNNPCAARSYCRGFRFPN